MIMNIISFSEKMASNDCPNKAELGSSSSSIFFLFPMGEAV